MNHITENCKNETLFGLVIDIAGNIFIYFLLIVFIYITIKILKEYF